MGVFFHEKGENSKSVRPYAAGFYCRCGAEKISQYTIKHFYMEPTPFINHCFDATGARRLVDEFKNSMNERGILNRLKPEKCRHSNDPASIQNSNIPFVYQRPLKEFLSLTSEETVFWIQLQLLFGRYRDNAIFMMQVDELIKMRYHLPQEEEALDEVSSITNSEDEYDSLLTAE